MRLLGPAIVVTLLVADQISKWFMLEHIFRPALGLGDPMRLADWLQNAPERLPDISITILPFFNLTMVWNFGISFGLMSGAGMALLIATVAITSFFIIWMMRATNKVEITALAMIIAGAIGNIADRLRFEAVADFLDFHAFGTHFPAFNVADASISLGVALLVLHSLFLNAKD